ncbi:hypothetical protein Geob_1793 [Geotalea daltonii FRC-32]|uniref:Uncharacterized protein n=1 Tax=Geotalea daltonii (strain DSM 22248 / JCM 15807 / FRC-32) TaxID=316067 RepID=B9M6U1_GEODF|nr:hypothetical protein [Geotalea daltonii]ACM20151.1 hypothetical protein Geob_1793 [Geotalea daltonii FRC-32]
MKKTAAFACLFLCLMPAWLKAEEPAPSTQPNYTLQPSAEEEAWRDRLLSEVNVNDEELVQIVGHGLETAIPIGVLSSGKLELAASKIKLWDEADKGITDNGNCLRRITLSTIGSK